MAETLKQKLEWMLSGGYLTDVGETSCVRME